MHVSIEVDARPLVIKEIAYRAASGARMRLLAALMLALSAAGCVQLGAIITNAPMNPDCVPGSVTKPCREDLRRFHLGV